MATAPVPPGATTANDDEDSVVLSAEEYLKILSRLSQMEKSIEVLTFRIVPEPEPETEPEAPEKQPPPKKTLCDKVKDKAMEQYKVHGTSVVSSVTSFDLLSKFEFNTALFIALVSMVAKIAFASIFTSVHAAKCVPSRTIMSGDWPNDTYTSLYNSKHRQYLCNTFFLDDFEFAVGNQHFREDWEKEFGFDNANIDLSMWEYDYVWPAWWGILKVTEGMGWANDVAVFDDSPEAQNLTTWFRLVAMEQSTHYAGGCAERCAELFSPAGFHAHNAQRGEWDCLCLNATVEQMLDGYVCSAEYSDPSSAASANCFFNNTDESEADWAAEAFFAWNDTVYNIQPFILFSRVSFEDLWNCSDAEVEDLCQDGLTRPLDGATKAPRTGAYLPQNPDDPDGQYWKPCTLPGFDCDDYQNEQCEQYGSVCGAQALGNFEVPCSGLVSVTYITCPPVLTTLGSSIGYISYLELAIVTLLVAFFLWRRGENPWYVLKANMKQLATVAATAVAEKEIANLKKDFAKEKTALSKEVGTSIFGAAENQKLELIKAQMKNVKGVQGVLDVPATTHTATPSSSTSSAKPRSTSRKGGPNATNDTLDVVEEFTI